MRPAERTKSRGRAMHRGAFSLAEMLVVTGVLALLVALLLPPLEQAREEAMVAKCMVHQSQIGLALETIRTEYRFYPQWDDSGDPFWGATGNDGPIEYTWIDLLVQRGAIGTTHVGLCPADPGPDPVMETRLRAAGAPHQPYPGKPQRTGMRLSFGIGLPLASGGWAWNDQTPNGPDGLCHYFDGHDRYHSRRVLAGDASWTAIFNLSGGAAETGIWNEGSQFDNTVSWRHPQHSANFLYQDGHVSRVRYQANAPSPVDTMSTFLWLPNEPLDMTFSDTFKGHAYPYIAPPSPVSNPPGEIVPAEVIPKYYSDNDLWTIAPHDR